MQHVNNVDEKRNMGKKSCNEEGKSATKCMEHFKRKFVKYVQCLFYYFYHEEKVDVFLQCFYS